jgi:hypothetical protein
MPATSARLDWRGSNTIKGGDCCPRCLAVGGMLLSALAGAGMNGGYGLHTGPCFARCRAQKHAARLS